MSEIGGSTYSGCTRGMNQNLDLTTSIRDIEYINKIRAMDRKQLLFKHKFG